MEMKAFSVQTWEEVELITNGALQSSLGLTKSPSAMAKINIASSMAKLFVSSGALSSRTYRTDFPPRVKVKFELESKFSSRCYLVYRTQWNNFFTVLRYFRILHNRVMSCLLNRVVQRTLSVLSQCARRHVNKSSTSGRGLRFLFYLWHIKTITTTDLCGAKNKLLLSYATTIFSRKPKVSDASSEKISRRGIIVSPKKQIFRPRKRSRNMKQKVHMKTRSSPQKVVYARQKS